MSPGQYNAYSPPNSAANGGWSNAYQSLTGRGNPYGDPSPSQQQQQQQQPQQPQLQQQLHQQQQQQPPYRGLMASPPSSFMESRQTDQLTPPPPAGAANGRPTNGNGSSMAPYRAPANGSTGNSPPTSGGRSSDGNAAYSAYDGPDARAPSRPPSVEESLAEHYAYLKVYLADTLKAEAGKDRGDRAKDKLLRLSAVPFHELSTDVFDESHRREEEQARGGLGAPGNSTPMSLLPKKGFHPKRNQARQKLSTLPADRFIKLATDVYYELERRFPRFTGSDMERITSPALSSASSNPRAPHSRSATPLGGPGAAGQIPPMPSLGRSSPAPGAELGLLAPPRGGTPLNGEAVRLQPKVSQANTIVPSKGTMMEEDDDQSDGDDDAFALEHVARAPAPDQSEALRQREKRIEEYEEKLATLQASYEQSEASHAEKDGQIRSLRRTEQDYRNKLESDRGDWEESREELQAKLAQAEQRLAMAQSEAGNVQREYAEAQRIFEQRLQDAAKQASSRGQGDEWKQRFDDVQRELKSQQDLAIALRREASHFLGEMRALSEHSATAMQSEERLLHEIHNLQSEVQSWRNKYVEVKARLGSTHASSASLSIPNGDTVLHKRCGSFIQPGGLVQELHITEFQVAIDELLQKSGSQEHGLVLEAAKAVLHSVHRISSDVEGISNHGGNARDDPMSSHERLTAGLAAASKALLVASRNHAKADGLVPASLLHAAASDLVAAVLEVVGIAKIAPAVATNGEPDLPLRITTPLKPAAANLRDPNGYDVENPYEGLQHSPAGSPASESWPEPVVDSRAVVASSKKGLEELKFFLQDQNAVLVRSIQPLVHLIRSRPSGTSLSPADEAAAADYIRNIGSSVQNICDRTDAAITSIGLPALEKHSVPVIATLQKCRSEILDSGSRLSKDGRETIPPVAFKVAKVTKELVNRVTGIETGEISASDNLPTEFR